MADLFVSYAVTSLITEKTWFESKVIEFEQPVATIDEITEICRRTGDLASHRDLTILYWRRMEEPNAKPAD